MRPYPAMNCEACGHENLDGARFCAGCGVRLPSAVSHASDPLIGQIIGGRFKVTGVLGEGGMGVVYSGEQPMGSAVRKVAIKTLHPHLSKDPSVLARFHRECGTVAQLEHPNTIKVYDFGSTSDGALYIAMEFVSGSALSDVIEKQGPLSPERVVKVMRQVCGALEEAHKQGVVHRDLKPENIVLTERAGETDFAKVLDFGIAGRTESADAQKEQKLTQQGMVLGTPPYMSPEQFTGKALDARSDIYSLAVVVYEMLTGRLPFDAETPWEWATQHMTAQPKPLEESVRANTNVPEHMRQAIMRALSKNREQRQSSAREFFQELSAGARLTVEHPVPSVEDLGTAGTAAMPAAPDFSSGGIAPTAAMPQVPLGAIGIGAATPPAVPAAGFGATPPIAVPAAAFAATRPRKGSGKGLVIGLGALGGVVGIVLLVVLLKSSKPTGEEIVLGGPLGGTTAPSSGQATIAPIVTAPATDSTEGQQIPATGSDDGPSSSAKTGGGSGKKQATGGSGQSSSSGGSSGQSSSSGGSPGQTTSSGTGASTVSGPGQTTGSGTSTGSSTGASASSGGDASCAQCVTAAKSGNIAGAASSYQKCGDAAKKRMCQALARSSAPRAAKAQALNGNCAGARAIINGAKAMGASSGNLDSALSGTSCK